MCVNHEQVEDQGYAALAFFISAELSMLGTQKENLCHPFPRQRPSSSLNQFGWLGRTHYPRLFFLFVAGGKNMARTTEQRALSVTIGSS